jgi:hypothetical protein
MLSGEFDAHCLNVELILINSINANDQLVRFVHNAALTT